MSDHEETGPADFDHTDEPKSIDNEHDGESALLADVFKWFEGLSDSSDSPHSGGEPDIKRPSDAIEQGNETVAVMNFVNSKGEDLRLTAFDGVTDDGLVWIAVWHGEVKSQTRTLARAELARRNAHSMRQSLSVSYTLAWAIFGLAALNLLLFVWHVTS